MNILVLGIFFFFSACTSSPESVLIFHKSVGYQHPATPTALSTLRASLAAEGIEVTETDDPALLKESILQQYGAIIFLNNEGDILGRSEEIEVQRFVEAGGGLVFLHRALMMEPEWDWLGALLAGRYVSHSTSAGSNQQLTLEKGVGEHTILANLPAEIAWEGSRMEVSEPGAGAEVLLREKESNNPVSWINEAGTGRVFVTTAGFQRATYSEESFQDHLVAGIRYAMGTSAPDYQQVTTPPIPEEDRFTREILLTYLDQPLELEILEDGRILFNERGGALKLYDPATDSVRVVGRLEVNTTFEDGFLGIALDPGFEENNWIYLYYSSPGPEPQQHLSRFVFKDDTLHHDSEIRMLEVVTQREECCHTGGSIEFGPDSLLYLSTGDNVNPFHSSGYGPFDERAGRTPFDAQASSANANDLRGKILRIKPEPDGGYSIPEGNLFPEGTEGTRPEIYVMGNRNPYRISIDPKTNYLYWGEVGPDAGNDDPLRGPRGHDEINQAREAGFFGWPFFVGDNKAYRDYNFETGESGPHYDPMAPVNDSPNNTGITALPPAKGAFIWYPYAASPEFPIVGAGGRNAMAGPVFYKDLYVQGQGTFPDYFEGKLFIFDWIRGWVMLVSMDERADLVELTPFMPATNFSNLIDIAFDKHGVLYTLEYGEGWVSGNAYSRLSKITYNGGNRPPQAILKASVSSGAIPLEVRLSASDTYDVDEDELTYHWYLDDEETGTSGAVDTVVTFLEAGTYKPFVLVSDNYGNTSRAEVEIRAGNAPPEVSLTLAGNQTFYFEEEPVPYQVAVRDREDGSLEEGGIAPTDVIIQMDYLERGYDRVLIEQGHQQADEVSGFLVGKRLMDESDCSSCHAIDRASIGPMYMQVAEKYKDTEGSIDYLADKIINGGGGVWGEVAMAAHPQFSKEDAKAIARYVLSLDDDNDESRMPMPASGEIAFTAHRAGENTEGMYFFRAVYTDEGAAGAGPLLAQELVALRHPLLQAETYDLTSGVQIVPAGEGEGDLVSGIYSGSHIGFSDIDLTQIVRVVFHVQAGDDTRNEGKVVLRVGSPTGTPIGEKAFSARTGLVEEVSMAITPVNRMVDLYVTFEEDEPTGHPLILLDAIRFYR